MTYYNSWIRLQQPPQIWLVRFFFFTFIHYNFYPALSDDTCPAASGGFCGKTCHARRWRKEQRGYRRLSYLLRLHTGASLSLTAGPDGCARCISYRQACRGVLGVSELLLITSIHRCKGIPLQAKEQSLLLALSCPSSRCWAWFTMGTDCVAGHLWVTALHSHCLPNAQSACDSVNFHLSLFFFQSRPHFCAAPPPTNHISKCG